MAAFQSLVTMSMRHRIRLSVRILLLLVLAACRDPIMASDGPLTVTASNGRLLAANHGDYPLSIAASDPEWLGLLTLCVEPALGCIIVPPQDTRTVILSEVHGYTPGGMIHVHYQELRPGSTPENPVGDRGFVAIRP